MVISRKEMGNQPPSVGGGEITPLLYATPSKSTVRPWLGAAVWVRSAERPARVIGLNPHCQTYIVRFEDNLILEVEANDLRDSAMAWRRN